MRKIIVSEFITIDGVIEDPGGAENSPYGGWSFSYWNDEAEKYKHEELFSSDALLLGRETYQGFAAAWPSMTDENGFADRMNSLPKYVVSNTLEKTEWNNSKIIKDNIIEEIQKLKEQPGQSIFIFGSGQLIHTLREHDLIDEYRLMVHPVVIGGGKKLFQDLAEQKSMKLVQTETFRSGIVVLVYQTQK